MSWHYDRSSERIKDHVEGMGKIEVQKLTKVANLEDLLSETTCREIYGSHVYVDVPNFAALASQCTDNADETKRLAQGIHVFQREVSRIVERENMFDGVRVHFQGAKLHALFYRPIDNGKRLGTLAVLLQLVVRDFVMNVFNPAFPKLGSFRIAGGADIGSVIGTRNGMRGDRELLFLGAPANYAAKIVGSAGTLRISEEVYDVLPDDIAEHCTVSTATDPDGNPLYEIAELTSDEVVTLCATHGVEWSPEESRGRVDEDKRNFPLSSISVEDATVLIDWEVLSIRKNKRIVGASLFADVAGFTHYVDAQETAEDKEDALRVFHAIRREMSRVVRTDFDGLRVQYQGDRLQGLFHLPKDDESSIVTRAVEAAVGLQSSMSLTLPIHVPKAKSLSLAIGIDVGTTFVSKLGSHGHRDRICIGEAVECAAFCEERHCGGEIALTKRAYDVLHKDLQQFFVREEATGDYVAQGLTADKVERTRKASIYDAPAVHVKREAAGLSVTAAASGGSREVYPARSYAS